MPWRRILPFSELSDVILWRLARVSRSADRTPPCSLLFSHDVPFAGLPSRRLGPFGEGPLLLVLLSSFDVVGAEHDLPSIYTQAPLLRRRVPFSWRFLW